MHPQGVNRELAFCAIDASSMRLTLFAPAARRVGNQAASRRSSPTVCHLEDGLRLCSLFDTGLAGPVPFLDG